MLSPSDIKGIAAKCKEMSDEGWSDALASEVVGDIPALLSHIEALEERLRKAGEYFEAIAFGGVPVGEACIGCKEVGNKIKLAAEALAELSHSAQ